MERTMRLNLAATKSKVTGWEKRQTSRPTSLMMTTKFIGVFILVSSLGRRLARPVEDIQLQYLKLLELTPDSRFAHFFAVVEAISFFGGCTQGESVVEQVYLAMEVSFDARRRINSSL